MGINTKEQEDIFNENVKSNTKIDISFEHQFDLGSHLHHSILPLLQQQPTTNLSKHDVINLANTFIKLKKYILNFDSSFASEQKDFFYSLVALSSNCIITNISAITKNQIQLICDTSSIFIEYLLKSMVNDNDHTKEDINKNFQKINLIYGFCAHKNSLLNKSELDFLCAILKSCKIPTELVSSNKNIPCFKTNQENQSNEFKRIKIDRIDYLFDHLALPIVIKKNENSVFYEDQNKNVKSTFFNKNQNTFRKLNGVNILLEFIKNFPVIKHHLNILNILEKNQKISFFELNSDETKLDLKTTLKELTKLTEFLTLPVIDLNQNDLALKLIQSLIYICVNLIVNYTITENKKDKNYELDDEVTYIRILVNLVSRFYKNKINSFNINNSNLLQNIHLYSVWINFLGLQTIIEHKTSSLNSLSLLLVSQALDSFTLILNDLAHDYIKDDSFFEKLVATSPLANEDFFYKFNFNIKLNVSERVKILFDKINILSLLLNLSYDSFELACDLTKESIENQDKHNYSSSQNSNRKTNSSSDESTKDDDCILGKLFIENEPSEFNVEENKNDNQDIILIENENKIQDFFEISKKIIIFVNSYFVCSETKFQKNFLTSCLKEVEIDLLSEIIKKLDCLDENRAFKKDIYYNEFSKIFSLFIHNLIATECFNKDYELLFLRKQNVHPALSDKDNYSFFIKPRVLSVLAQFLMIKIKQEKDEFKSDKNSLCLSLWKCVLERLVDLIKTKDTFLDNENSFEDINLEHAQLLLFIFHNTTILQRKSIALDLCQKIFELSESLNLTEDFLTNRQTLYLSRLLHLFEYIIKNFYEIPQHLIEQINCNLFEFHCEKNKSNSQNNFDNLEKPFNSNYCQTNHLKSKFKYNAFYDLLYSDYKQLDQSQRINDIALHFLFCFKSDKITYDKFYDGFMKFLNIGSYFNTNLLNEKDFCQCNIQYCFNIIWRLFHILPPSAKYLQDISIENLKQDNLKILNLIVWQTRIKKSKQYKNFVLATLKKQSPPEFIAEDFLNNYLKNSSSLNFNVLLLKNYLNQNFEGNKIPNVFVQFILESLISKIWILLENSINKKTSCFYLNNELIEDSLFCTENKFYSDNSINCLIELYQILSKAVDLYYNYFKQTILTTIDFDQIYENHHKDYSKIFDDILSISGYEEFITTKKFSEIFPYDFKFNNLFKTLQKNDSIDEFFDAKWKEKILKLDLPSEKVISDNWKVHFLQLSTTYTSINEDFYYSSHLGYSILVYLNFIENIISWHQSNEKVKNYNQDHNMILYDNIIKISIPISTDLTMQPFLSYCKNTGVIYNWYLSKIDLIKFESSLKVARTSYRLLTEQHEFVKYEFKLNCLRFFENLLETVPKQIVLEKFFSEDEISLLNLLRTSSKKESGNLYAVSMLKFLLEMTIKVDLSESASLNKLFSIFVEEYQNSNSLENEGWIENWIYKILCIKDCEKELIGLYPNEDNYLLLKKLSNYAIKSSSLINENFTTELVKSLIKIATSLLNESNCDLNFPELMVIMTTLASKEKCFSHFNLIQACFNWLEICLNYLNNKEILEKIEKGINIGRHQAILQSVSFILSYLDFVFESLRILSNEKEYISLESEINNCGENYLEINWVDDLVLDNEDTNSETSNEDFLSNSLCTFTVTQKVFKNQYWYYCHTCKMVDGLGVCSVCVKVCHKDHDVTFAKYGSFFCDCGAKEDLSCQALVKRTSTIEKTNVYKSSSKNFSKEELDQKNFLNSTKSKNRSKLKPNLEKKIKIELICKQIKEKKDFLISEIRKNNVCTKVVNLLSTLSDTVIKKNERFSLINRAFRTKKALNDLHEISKIGVQSDYIVNPTLGSQEGAFENMKPCFTGDQGQRIKNLIHNNTLKKKGIQIINHINSKKQHLAISNDKGKIIILQLSSLLKQIVSAKQKIHLTRLASASVSFNLITIAANSYNDSVLSVCGLKECNVLIFNSTGNLSSQLNLQLNLTKVNYIVKSIWLPCSQTELAIVTSNFVSIYNLSISLSTPKYCFELADKIRDTTFLYTLEGKKYIIFLSVSGEVYYEQLNLNSATENSTFFVTSQIDIYFDNSKRDSSRLFNDGGVSIYYSHLFQLLFISYENGKTIAVPFPDIKLAIKDYFDISVSSNSNNDNVYLAENLEVSETEKFLENSSSENKNMKLVLNKKQNFKSVCNWYEVYNHPGLVVSSTKEDNIPVMFSITPEAISYQEVKENIKSKISDSIALRHYINEETSTTTMIILCEDGSLQVFDACNENTNYWLNPIFSCSKYCDKQSLAFCKSKKQRKNNDQISSENQKRDVSFPIDFFENTQLINDIEFGGNDLLQVYNSAQLKNRLMVQRTYIASTKPHGFTLEVTNNDPSMIVVGIRILLGNQSTNQVPSFIVVFDRSIYIQLNRYRWFDIPFTKEESLLAERKFNIYFGPPFDSSSITYVDSVCVYGKQRDLFLWPDEENELKNLNNQAKSSQSSVCTDIDVISLACPYSNEPNVLERILSSSFDIINNSSLIKNIELQEANKTNSWKVITNILTLPFPVTVHQKMKNLLLQLHPDKKSFYLNRDKIIFGYIINVFSKNEKIEGELFLRILILLKSILGYRSHNFINFIQELLKKLNETDDKSENFIKVLIKSSEKEVDKEKLSVEMVIILFMNYLNKVFWKFNEKWPKFHLTVFSNGNAILELITQSLIEVIYCFTVMNENYLNDAMAIFMNFFCAENIIFSYNTKQVLMHLLKNKKSKIKNSNKKDEYQNSSSVSNEIINKAINKSPNTNSEIVQIDEDSDDLDVNLEQQSHFVDDFENSYSEIENLAEEMINSSLNNEEIFDQLPLYQILNEPFFDDFEEFAENIWAENPINEIRNEQNDENITESLQNKPENSSLTPESDIILDKQEILKNYSSLDKFNSIKISKEKKQNLKVLLLESLIANLKEINSIGGIRCIPYMQITLMLSFELDVTIQNHKILLKKVITELIKLLKKDEKINFLEKSFANELKLVVLRFLSILLSRFQPSDSFLAEQNVVKNDDIKNSNNLDNQFTPVLSAKETINILADSNVSGFCLNILIHLIGFWKISQNEIEEMNSSKKSFKENNDFQCVNLLKPNYKITKNLAKLDMSPFFLKQYVEDQAEDVFCLFPQLLSEVVLRLSYQMKKISNILGLNLKFIYGQEWTDVLCQYLMLQLTPCVRKHVRKLLTFICGSKDECRKVRDFYLLNSYFNNIRRLCNFKVSDQKALEDNKIKFLYSVSYDDTILLIENLNSVLEIANNRTNNWKNFCLNNSYTLYFLIETSLFLDENVSNTILQLLQLGLSSKNLEAEKNSPEMPKKKNIVEDIIVELVKEEKNQLSNENDKSDKENNSILLANQLAKKLNVSLLSEFVCTFLLESNNSSIRWQCHSLLFKTFTNFEENSDETKLLLDSLWILWDKVANYGPKASQFIDLLGYFTFKNSTKEEFCSSMQIHVKKIIELLVVQNNHIFNHSNFLIYNNMQKFVNFDGFYLDSEPCLECNNPEISYSNLKLSSLKVDSRFTTATQIVKLVGSHLISKINLRISDIKKTKMVKVINIYYNNLSVQSAVELKNRTVWQKAKNCYLTTGQTEVKIEFPLPITACNLKIEYAEFYENQQANNENIQCPRCSTAVPPNPGVCSHCGENVFQCHKCRSINYDVKDPFLCNSCGFCKYAKFDFILVAKVTCAVDPIKDEEGRKKTVQNINSSLVRADTIYKNLNTVRPSLEVLLMKIEECSSIDKIPEETNSSSNQNFVNKTIQQLALKYCTECKLMYEELSKINQKLIASRKELLIYDNLQRLDSYSQILNDKIDNKYLIRQDSKIFSSEKNYNRCYGCATSTIEHCIRLLKSLAIIPFYRNYLCENNLLKILFNQNLKFNNTNLRNEVRNLLSLLIKDNLNATLKLESMINIKLNDYFKFEYQNHLNISDLISNEVAILSTALKPEDTCWELKLKCLVYLFLIGINENKLDILNTVILPCLKVISSLIKTEVFNEEKSKNSEWLNYFILINYKNSININKWFDKNSDYTFDYWKSIIFESVTTSIDSKEFFLAKKYLNKWQSKIYNQKELIIGGKKVSRNDWFKSLIFNKYSSPVRMMTCSLIENIFKISNRKIEIVHFLTNYLDDIYKHGSYSSEFFKLYTNIIKQNYWKYYLALKGLLPNLGKLINNEIEYLLKLDDENMNSDLSDGLTLKFLVDLLISFVDVELIRQHFKSKLVVFMLNGYLSLRKLVIRRTKIIDETQDSLLELLEEMTTGTESETASFMSVCLQSVKCCKLDDLRTPVFIFERLCSIIYPEDVNTSEFFITLEKDTAQEDFLQGRMLGNPYSSIDSGMGPLMRDIKNKVCQDCELVALLEDDSGMELLVMDKIISLDLPVKEVYRKIWLAENNENDPMLIVYRMRGLMGDATEEFIQNLDSKNVENENVEEVYKMAKVMSTCDGLEVMLERLNMIKDLSARCKPLLIVLLKLFDHCVKIKTNRIYLLNPKLNTISILIKVLKIIIGSPAASLSMSTDLSQVNKSNLLEQILKTMEVILQECSKQSLDQIKQFLSNVTSKDFDFLLHSLNSENVQKDNNVLQLILKIIPFLTLDSCSKMEVVLEYFKPCLNFNEFDFQNDKISNLKLEWFCILVNSVENNETCSLFKDFIVSQDVVSQALEYLTTHSPPIKNALLANSREWKEFATKPALKFVLRILTGITTCHQKSQILITAEYIAILHGLEQVSSFAHVGSLAEIFLESLKENLEVASIIEKVRKETKEEKKRLAMAVRQKQLGELGLKANERGQVIAQSCVLKQVEDLGEEQGLTCIICREGYKFQPNKVLGIYTYTKKCPLEPFEAKTSKAMGYSSVTHFNIIHFECHLSAVKHARIRDEWESAALQNGNTKCNGLLPLWGPEVQDSVFASSLVHHNSYLQDCTSCRENSCSVTIHDFKLLLIKFANEESFSIDSGGGGPQSNIHLIPYLLHKALYLMKTTQKVSRYSKLVKMFLEAPLSKVIENSFEVENVYYFSALCLTVYSPKCWQKTKINFLKRFIITGHARKSIQKGKSITSFTDLTPKEYKDYKTELIYFGLISAIFEKLFKNVKNLETDEEETWSTNLADYIRHNDQQLLDLGDELLQFYEQDLLPCSSFEEFCDLCGLLKEIDDPQNFIADTLKNV